MLGQVGYDADFENSDRIYRINSEKQWVQMTEPMTPYPLAPAMKAEFPEVEQAARAQRIYSAFVKRGEEYVNEYYFVSADPEIFDLFSIKVVEGDPARLLEDPNSIAISEHIAAKYFPDESPMGKVMSVMVGEQSYEFQVTGVFKDFPKKCTFRAQFVVPLHVSEQFFLGFFKGMEIDLADAWYTADMWLTYVLLEKNADATRLQEKLEDLSTRHSRPDAVTHFVLQPLKSIYFHSSHLVNPTRPQGNLRAIYVLILIAVSILVLACVNYVILSTAQITTRLGEIGVRKTVGATRRSVVFQILSESILLAVLALPVAIGLMELALPHVNKLFRTYLQLKLLDNWQFTLGAVLVTVVAGLLSGAYVAFYQSAVQPVDVLRSRLLIRAGRFNLRRLLVVFQLVIFVVLISCAAHVYLQVDYAMNRDPGFETNDLLFASSSDGDFARKYQSLKNEILQIPGVISVTGAALLPPTDSRMVSRVASAADPTVKVPVEGLTVDYDFVKTLGLTVVDGREFSRDADQPDFRSGILNETAVKALGYETPAGAIFHEASRIVGVVEDFNIHSVRNEIAPLIIRLNTDYVREIAVRFEPGKMAAVRASLNKLWEERFPGESEAFYTYDEQVPYLYTDEKRVGEIVTYSALIAVFICCMGMFGLSLFVTRSRTKEIGIRKTFGASTSSVVRILVREYVWLVAIATVLSVPITYYFMNRWLENFVFRISIGWYVFVGSGLVALIVALATVSVQAYLAARANPVDSLRYE